MTDLLTAAEVADELRVSTRSIVRWVEAGKLPAVKLPGGMLRIRRSDLDQWIESRQTCPTEAPGPTLRAVE